MRKIVFTVQVPITLAGCATDGPKSAAANKIMIGTPAINVDQAKASVDAALGAPDSVDVFDPATHFETTMFMQEMEAGNGTRL